MQLGAFPEFRRFLRHKGAVAGGALLLAMVLGAVLAPRLAPYDPVGHDQRASLQAPGRSHALGTDVFGRDILSRVIWGGRESLRVGLLAVAVGGIIGTVLGLLAGYYEGWTGTIVLRLTDLLLALPGILLALTIVAATGPSLENVIVAVGVSSMPAYIRVVNGSVLDLKTRTFIEAVKASGAVDLRVIARHVLPNILAPVIVLSTLGLGNALLIAATLSFLGLGAQPPSPEWGAMLSQGREFIFGYWWIATFPGLAILVAVIGANLLGEGMRDLLDPRLRV
ncbi:MAG TPA: ABC transporter permease [Methylomirabilota bacterium]|nr:ABC transporter permease [Methylomirabilota bacterium]